MNRVTISVGAFLVFAIVASAWLLLRAPTQGSAEQLLEAPTGAGSTHAGMTFAEWAARADGVLLADIDPGASGSTVPKSFQVLNVKADQDGRHVEVTDGPSFSWAPEERQTSTGKLFVLGFRVSTEGLAFPSPEDPLWSEPIAHTDGGTEQLVTLKSKGGITAVFTRRRGDPSTAPYWNRRAIGFGSPDGRFVYVTPDHVVIPVSAATPH